MIDFCYKMNKYYIKMQCLRTHLLSISTHLHFILLPFYSLFIEQRTTSSQMFWVFGRIILILYGCKYQPQGCQLKPPQYAPHDKTERYG